VGRLGDGESARSACGRRVYRSKAYLAAALAGFAFYASGVASVRGTTPSSPGNAAVFYTSAVLIGIFMVRAVQASVVVTDTEVIAKGLLRTRKVPWRDVERFDTAAAGFGSSGVVLVTVDGRRLRLWGLGGPSSVMDPDGSDGAPDPARELNGERLRRSRAPAES
jgi:hypothetical protein